MQLCAKALDPREKNWDAILSELQFAIQERTLRPANLSVVASVSGQILQDRRKNSDLPQTPHDIRALFALHTRKRTGSHYRKSRLGIEPPPRSTCHRG